MSALMTQDHAMEINGMLVAAWMAREGIRDCAVPSFRGITLAECAEATRVVSSSNPIKVADGKSTYECTVDPSRLAKLYAWAALRSQM